MLRWTRIRGIEGGRRSISFEGRSLAFADGKRYSFWILLYLADVQLKSTSQVDNRGLELRGGRSGLKSLVG